MNLIDNIRFSIIEHSNQNAFFINNIFYSYSDFALQISKIRSYIVHEIEDSETIIGLVSNDDIETYAAIIALWLEGKSYVPINSEAPENWIDNIIEQACLTTILDSSFREFCPRVKVISLIGPVKAGINLIAKNVSDDKLAYMLFTSGTTGSPKGVPISRGNLSGFIKGFESIGFDINKNDRCLQMFELSFDVSVASFLFPILKGACIFTIPKNEIKYTYVFQLMEEHKLTFVSMVPSLLQYLRPYFAEIYLPDIKYTILTAEALPVDLAEEWSRCIPNSEIYNLYGPTENTIFSTIYHFQRNNKNKTINGILSIGKPIDGSGAIIIDENNHLLSHGEKGEMCLSGSLLTPGYWNNLEKNKNSFFYLENQDGAERFYKTGDLCLFDESDNIMYLGRIDSQVKIQGFRVELSEVEFHCRVYLSKINIAAVTFHNKLKISEIGLVIESSSFDTEELMTYLKGKLPNYMIPTKICFLASLPLNDNGKIDRNKLKLIFNQ